VFEWTVDSLDDPWLAFDDTDLATCGTDLIGTQCLGLLEGSGFQGPRRQSLDRGRGHFFHLVHIHVQSGPMFPESVPDDNFPPLPGDLTNAIKVGSRQLACAHDLSILGVTTINAGEHPPQQSNQSPFQLKVLLALSIPKVRNGPLTPHR